jgi:glycopeptide antibiotics resistance protein
MPLGYILVKITKMRILLNILLGMGIIIILEIIQFITKRGVLDIADILLNSLGLFISIIITKERGHKKYVR